MKKNKLQFVWHCHHDVLLEPLTEPLENRIRYIKENKPKNEIELRLKLLKFVKGKLPEKFVEAGKAYDEARKAHYEARKAYDEAGKAHYETEKAYYEAGKAYYEAGKAHYEARKAYYEAEKACEKEINALHKKECPDCPWDGKSIFKK